LSHNRADLKKKKNRFYRRKSGRESTEEGPRGERFHATSPLLTTSCAANDETTMHYFTDCFRLGDHPRPSGLNMRYALHLISRLAAATDC